MSVSLYPHQVEDLKAMRDHKSFALYHEVGAGKSFPCILRVLELLSEHGGMAIVFTEISLLGQLQEDFYQVIGNREEVDVATISGKKKKSQRDRILKCPPDILIANYEYAQQLEKWAASQPITVVWCDEGHRLKGFRGMRSKYGKRAKSIIRVAHGCEYRLLTTGSPIVSPNSPDIWAMYYYLDPKIFGPTLWKFEQEFFYNVVQGQPFKKLVLRPDMKDEMSRRMYLCARRLLKRELDIDFPDRGEPIRYDAHMSAKLAKAYKDLEQMSMTVAEGEVVTRPLLLGRLMSLQQMASGFLIQRDDADPLGLTKDNSTRRVLEIDPKHKLEVLDQILRNIGDESCIIWAVFTHEIDFIMEAVKRIRGHHAARADGQVTGRAREHQLQAFKSGKTPTLVAHPGAAGAGLNLQIAGHAIRWSRSYKLIEWEQSRGRNHRAGSKIHEAIFDHEIVTPDTTDEKVYEAISEKVDLAGKITMDFLGKEARNK